ncbi:MAG: alkaline phosphatase D family protein [Planctomycetota bacterium]
MGHVDHTRAILWARLPRVGRCAITLEHGASIQTIEGEARDEHDRCVRFEARDLAPASDYRYELRQGAEVLAAGPTCRFRTAPAPETPARVKLALGSCAASEPSSVWSTIMLAGAEGLVLLGDTPYIDSTDLNVAREKHRRFLEVPELACLARTLPVWGTWDDHDFGKNDSDGTLPGKAEARRAFVEYRAHVNDGDGEGGVYTSFRRGPIEVFLLDARWFARTAPVSATDPRPTLLGEAQWQWLFHGLLASTAPFKVIASGMIWDDKENSESDDWGSYPYERERLERFIGEYVIPGVVLVGGDIHVSRHLRYPESKARAGYVLDQLIVSPLHERVIPSLDVPHPALLWSAREPRVFLTLEASTLGEAPTLEACWVQDTGRGAGRELRGARWTAQELSAR